MTLSIIRAYSPRSKSATGQRSQQKAPNLYAYITAVAKRGNSSDQGIEFFFARTRVVKNTYKPVFNESFAYERDPHVPYTLGTDNVFRVYLYDQEAGWGADESLGFFEIDLSQEAADLEDRTAAAATPERVGIIDYHGFRSTVSYKLFLRLDPRGSRTPGATIDDDIGIDP